MKYDYVIIGGGCYGSYYVKQLLEARDRGKLEWERVAVLDRDPRCAVVRAAPDDVDVVEAEWTAFGRVAFDDPDKWMGGQLVPAPIAPHIVRHWLVWALENAGAQVRAARWNSATPSDLPYANVTDGGSLVLSWAPGLCPTNCVEPRLCPLTQGERWWDMPDTVASLADDGQLDAIATVVCRHHAYGVGTIGFDAIADARRRLLELSSPARVGIATVSGCHGLMDVIEILDDRI